MGTMVIAYLGDFLVRYLGGVGETLESCVPWEKVEACQAGAAEVAVEAAKELGFPGAPFVCSRLTQHYHTGCCMYSTLGLNLQGVEDPVPKFEEIIHRMKARILQEGGSISHHHGIGKLRKEFMPLVHDARAFGVL